MQPGSFAFPAHGQPLEAVSEPVQAVMKRGKETLDWPHAGEKREKKKREKQTQFSFRIKSAAHIAGKHGAPTHGCGAACSSPPGTLAPLVWGGWAAWCGQSEGTQGPRRCLASFGGTRSSRCPALGEALHSLPCQASPGTPHLAHTPRAGAPPAPRPAAAQEAATHRLVAGPSWRCLSPSRGAHSTRREHNPSSH